VMSVLFTAPDYDRLERLAVEHCPLNKRPTEEQQRMIETLFKIEREEGVPEFARGILAAAACREAAYKLRVGCGDGGASCGLFQFHSSHNPRLRAMGAKGEDPRSDTLAGARYWLRLLKRQLKIARRDCKGEKHGYPTYDEYIWASANKTATWKYKCRRWGKCRKWNAKGECEKRYCISQGARCSIPPWKWRGSGRHRRQETRHWDLKRDWHLLAEGFREANALDQRKAK